MTALSRALARAAERLKGVSDTPRLDSELLLAHALGIERDALLLNPPPVTEPAAFAGFLERRRAGEPVAYITGKRGFWNIELEVGPGVLVPRPDSETLIAAALDHFERGPEPSRILDLGTGPGTLLLAALDQWPRATGIGVDASEQALEYARANARRLGLGQRAMFRKGDWAKGITERFDLVLINPPYVAEDAELGTGVAEYEPSEALFAGPEGLDEYRRLAPEIARLLAPGGMAAIEIGHDQAEAVTSLLEAEGLKPMLLHDMGGRPRALVVQS
ncbi:peptide chain release factor N(5)-glutamine methyltransferase [Sphingomonas sp. HDW15A]|uniref:peptide chain release factor N(5)-glutamine methyltransferase n=1 Tax=Sphingomonas sp. HDW15A TaxID=2714942 RepID=UPI00140E85D9|nr:peptide chain release factor N(5)-glutamine methyltransferase [Sphingomonas sp. HDW15A]QIK97056.1 peptide chain release factor N(5)-glutamine methyltransferase [Sphingomonas sp. HDW15A]